MTSVFTTMTQPQFVTNWVDAWGDSLGITPNLPVGNIALAVAEADANQATVLQYMAVVVIGFARASTSTGPDLDSWMADFGFTRLPAQFSTGQVTFSAGTPLTQPAFIPVGTIVQTPGGAIQYQVIADNSLVNFNAATQQYTIPVGQSSVNVAVQAAIPGSTFNVQAGQLSQTTSNLFGITSVTNGLALQEGTNTETDPAFRARFVAFINSLSQATEEAIFEAIDSLQSGLNIALYENVIAFSSGATVTMTISGTPAGTGTTSIITTNSQISGGSNTTVYNNVSGDTVPATYASDLAAAINADTNINGFITATATNNIVTLVSTSSFPTSYQASATAGAPVFAIFSPTTGFITATDNPIAYGNIVAFVADAQGNTSPGLLAQSLTAVGNTVAFGIRYQVLPPAINIITITENVRIGPNGVVATVETNVQTGTAVFINALPIGSIVYYSEVIENAFEADPNVIAVEPGSVTINGEADDLIQQPWQLSQTTIQNITVGTY